MHVWCIADRLRSRQGGTYTLRLLRTLVYCLTLREARVSGAGAGRDILWVSNRPWQYIRRRFVYSFILVTDTRKFGSDPDTLERLSHVRPRHVVADKGHFGWQALAGVGGTDCSLCRRPWNAHTSWRAPTQVAIAIIPPLDVFVKCQIPPSPSVSVVSRSSSSSCIARKAPRW